MHLLKSTILRAGLCPLLAAMASSFPSRAQLPPLDTALAPFYHGVASGDPSRGRVVLWTRVTPPSGAGQIPVTWRIATDTSFLQVVQSGTAVAKPYHDYTVKVTVTGLAKNTWYYYQFFALGKYSLTGRTRTLPFGAITDSVRMAIVSCSNFQGGYFNAYEALAQRNDVDVVLHLGDYIYEYDTTVNYFNPALNRTHVPSTEAITKSDYWARYSQYRLDPQARFLHQQYPMIAIWDDHEAADNAWIGGAANHDSLTEGDWSVRVTAARQAYVRWMPVIKPESKVDSSRLYRKFDFGKLIRLSILDTRLQGRTVQLDPSDPGFNDTARTLLGWGQREWLQKKISSSKAQWNILGQQVMVTPLTVFGTILNNDQWDGYPAERDRLYGWLQQYASKNFVVLTGDIHSSWGNDLPLPGYGIFNRSASAAVEFVTPSVSSPNPYSSLSPGLVQLTNIHARYVDLSYYGFAILDVNHDRVQCDWYAVSTVASTAYATSHKASWYVNDGEKFLREAAGPAVRPASKQVPFAPALPMAAPPSPARSVAAAVMPFVVLGSYPNPFSEAFSVQLQCPATDRLTVRLADRSGRTVFAEERDVAGGLQALMITPGPLDAGTYVLTVETGAGSWSGWLVKSP